MGKTENRSDGWKYAKNSGHENEELVKALFNDCNFKTEFAKIIEKNEILSTSITGKNETGSDSIIEEEHRKTKVKGDLIIKCDDDYSSHISIKKVKGDKYI
jgi:hypothetical protein